MTGLWGEVTDMRRCGALKGDEVNWLVGGEGHISGAGSFFKIISATSIIFFFGEVRRR